MINATNSVYCLPSTCMGTALQSYTPNSGFIDNTARIALLPIQTRLNKLAVLSNNWDGNGSLAPNEETISKASSQICGFFMSTTKTRCQWIHPLISVSEVGEVTCEWWGIGQKKLTIYIGEDHTDYVKVWGLDIDNEMDEGSLDSLGFVFLWKWLYS